MQIMQVHALLSELAMVEEEIVWLERKVEEMKMRLYHEKKLTKEWRLLRSEAEKQQRRLQRANHLLCRPENSSMLNKDLQVGTRSQNYDEFSTRRMKSRRASVGSEIEILSMSSTASPGKFDVLT